MVLEEWEGGRVGGDIWIFPGAAEERSVAGWDSVFAVDGEGEVFKREALSEEEVAGRMEAIREREEEREEEREGGVKKRKQTSRAEKLGIMKGVSRVSVSVGSSE